jgi:hypothetical protein
MQDSLGMLVTIFAASLTAFFIVQDNCPSASHVVQPSGAEDSQLTAILAPFGHFASGLSGP